MARTTASKAGEGKAGAKDREPTDKKPPGRPTKFKREFIEQARKLCLLGATDQEMADFFEVEIRTIYRWKNDNEAFCHAIKAGKDEADDRVERSLYQQAIGYEQDEVKIFMPAGAEAPVYAPYRAKIAPNVTAGIFWLKNRRRELWRDKIDTEHSGEVGVTIQRKVFRKGDDASD